MDSRNPFLKGFKKLKRKLAGGRKRDGRSGSDNDLEGREADVEGGEASQRSSRPHPKVGGAGIGPGQEGNEVDGKKVGQVNPPTSTPSIPRSTEPNST
jgi:hypothetical protein